MLIFLAKRGVECLYLVSYAGAMTIFIPSQENPTPTSVLNGPRLEPLSLPTQQLIVFLHGYGADGHDLIELGGHFQQLLPHAACVSPHAPDVCAISPFGREWFPLERRTMQEM